MILAVHPISFNTDTQSLTGPIGERRLPRQMALILAALMRKPGKPIGMDAMIFAMYPDEDEPRYPKRPDRVLQVRLAHLRHALKDVGAGNILSNVWGKGWMIAATATHRHVRYLTDEQALVVDLMYPRTDHHA